MDPRGGSVETETVNLLNGPNINIFQALTSAAIFWILHRNQSEVPFTITLSWKRKLNSSSTAALESVSKRKNDFDPFTECGRRKALGIALGEIHIAGDEPMKFEILSSKKQQSSCTLFGVFVAETTQTSARAHSPRAYSEGDAFSKFMDKEQEIKDAVISAFGLDPVYCSKFTFTVKMTRSTSISPAERVRLVLDTLRDFKVPVNVVFVVRNHMNSSLRRNRKVTAESIVK